MLVDVNGDDGRFLHRTFVAPAQSCAPHLDVRPMGNALFGWPASQVPRREFEGFVAEAAASLVQTAYLMTWNTAGAEDMVHETLLRVARRWGQVRKISARSLRQAHLGQP